MNSIVSGLLSSLTSKSFSNRVVIRTVDMNLFDSIKYAVYRQFISNPSADPQAKIFEHKGPHLISEISTVSIEKQKNR